ncbi:MAG: PqqD family protein [Anaerocolumna sp.]
MNPKLIKNSYLKLIPDELLFSTLINGNRTNLIINSSAFDILELCTGYYTLEDIVNILSSRYGESEDIVKFFVINFLTPLFNQNVISDMKTNETTNIVKEYPVNAAN